MGVKVRLRDGAYWLFIDHRGKRKARRVGTGPAGKKAAALAATKIAAALATGEADPAIFRVGVPEAPPTFETFARQWLDSLASTRGLRPASVKTYASLLRALVLPAI